MQNTKKYRIFKSIESIDFKTEIITKLLEVNFLVVTFILERNT